MSELGFGGKDYKFRPKSDFFISLLSDGIYPLLATLPADKIFNKICVVVSEGPDGQRTLQYMLKKTNNGSNGLQYESPVIPIPPEFGNLDHDELSREIGENVRENLRLIEGKYPPSL